jgi:hypothetical protein
MTFTLLRVQNAEVNCHQKTSGEPEKNAYTERFGGKLRGEFLSATPLRSLANATKYAENLEQLAA